MASKERSALKKNAANPTGTMTVAEHLGELRKCIVIIVVTFLAATLISYAFAPRFLRRCLDLAEGYYFVQTGPAELMGQYIKASILCGVVVALPVLIWQVHRFASPGLTKNEDRVFLAVMLGGLLFFAAGVAFAYLIVVPFMLQFFLSLNTIDIGGMYSVKEYMTYLISVLLAFGIVFEIPVLSSILALVGFLRAELMVRARKVVIVVNFVIGAAITPTDVVSQLLVAVPMCLLYELSIVLVRLICAAKRRANPEEAEEEEQAQEEMRRERRSRWARAAAMADRQAAEKEEEKA